MNVQIPLHEESPEALLEGDLDMPPHARGIRAMRAPCELSLVPGAKHLFEEPGAPGEVARRALAWFEAHRVLETVGRS